LTQVKQLLIGGEALSVAHVGRALELLPDTRIINGYGPTESTTFACCYPIPRKLDPDARAIPLGRPIGNTRIYIADSSMNPVAIGVTGEIYIGGEGVARGYLHRPELTAEKFLQHSFDGEPARRLYRTGDLARYRADGNIEFFGRLDDQVKIRGHRIEPGEIEAVLKAHPAVRQCVVIAREVAVSDSGYSISQLETPTEKRLVAYVATNGQPQIQELRTFVKQKLPDYMVPSAFTVLDNLALTPNGKIDRNALPPPDFGSFRLESPYVAPRNSIEEIVVSIWSDVLGLPQIGAHDNFFDVGGHSLTATRVVSRLRTKFNADIRLQHIFECPTIAELAALIGADRGANTYHDDRLLGEIEKMSEEEAHKLLDAD